MSNWRNTWRICLSVAALVLTAALAPAEVEPVSVRLLAFVGWTGDQAPVGAGLASASLVVTDEKGGVQWVDIGDPAAPQLRGRWVGTALPIDLAVAEARAYVATDTGIVSILDAADPAKPSEVGQYRAEGAVSAVAVLANRLCVGWRRGAGATAECSVDLVDVTQPAQPVRTGQIPLLFEPAMRSLQFEPSPLFRQLLYVEADALYGFDVSDPGNPVRDLLTVFEQISGLARVRVRVFEGNAYALGHARFSGSLAIYGLPVGAAALTPLGGWPTLGNATDFWVDERLLMVVEYPFSWEPPVPAVLTVISLEDIYQPQLAGKCELDPALGSPVFLRARGHRIYLGTTRGLAVFEVAPEPAFRPLPVRTPDGLWLRWNTAALGMRLEWTATLRSPHWAPLAGTEATNATTVPVTGEASFFRLVRP